MNGLDRFADIARTRTICCSSFRMRVGLAYDGMLSRGRFTSTFYEGLVRLPALSAPDIRTHAEPRHCHRRWLDPPPAHSCIVRYEALTKGNSGSCPGQLGGHYGPTPDKALREHLATRIVDVIPIAQGMGADASALESCTSHMVWLGGQREKAVETRPGANMKVAAAWTLEEQTSPFFEHFLKECWPCEDPLLVFTRKTTVEGRRFKLLSGSHIAKRTLLSNTGLTTAVFCDEYGIAAKHDRKNG
uniref:Retrotransposon hot spot (RHS) protein n=1 Tax=Panagrellus redivivus TaxID=6233 RepID=A0A7E4VU18_PANRE